MGACTPLVTVGCGLWQVRIFCEHFNNHAAHLLLVATVAALVIA